MAKRPNKIDVITWILLVIVLISNVLSIYSSVCSKNDIPIIVKKAVNTTTQKIDYAKINESINSKVDEKIKSLNIVQPKYGEDSVSTIEKTTETIIKEVPIKGDTGAKGNTGPSAYDIAIKNGFLGSEKEWLLSLKGNDGNNGFIDIQCNTVKNRWEVKYAIDETWKILNNRVTKCTTN